MLDEQIKGYLAANPNSDFLEKLDFLLQPTESEDRLRQRASLLYKITGRNYDPVDQQDEVYASLYQVRGKSYRLEEDPIAYQQAVKILAEQNFH